MKSCRPSALFALELLLFCIGISYCHAFLPTAKPSIVSVISHANIKSYNQIWLKDLWDEVIEMSTYGPGERKIRKERRRQKAVEDESDVSLESFMEAAKKQEKSSNASSKIDDATTVGEMDNDSSSADTSLKAFQAAVANRSDKKLSDFDGYALRDLLVDLWGAPLDVGFERQPRSVHCTVFPVAFGNWKCQHTSEISYLMHLQGVIEILDKYNNLEPYVNFLLTTQNTPKPGTTGIRYRLELSEEQLDSILNTQM